MNKHMVRTFPLAAGLGVAALVLAGCAGGSSVAQSPLGTSTLSRGPAVPASAQVAPLRQWRPDRGHSWMSPDAGKKTLMYVSDVGTATVQVFSYPDGAQVGTLTGFGYPQGECTDASGNVYIADASNANVVEYAHGGTSPINTLQDTGDFPASCAVDPNSGNVAVANLLTAQNFNAGNIAIYAKGSSTPTYYGDPVITREYFLAYDQSGNIYVDGVSGQTGYFRFTKMTPDGTFTEVPIKGAKLSFPGGVQADGSNMAVVDQQGSVVGKPDLYRITPAGKIAGKTTFATSSDGRLIDPVQFVFPAKSGKKVQILVADAFGGDVSLNTYPKGAFVSSYSSGLLQPLGVTLSPASH